jgi:prolyl-tRNA synthetase
MLTANPISARRSEIFTKTSKTAPADEVAKNAQLLIRAGFIDKQMAGVYAFLPLGLKTLEKIKQIIREEMNAVGGQELLMTSLQNRAVWETTGRWDDDLVDIWFKTRLKNDEEIGLGWSHEEPIMAMLAQFVTSYKDLKQPVSVYQFQNKLRNELRAKSGIMRGREFLMKDMYSVHANQKDLDKYYEKVAAAYEKVYQRLGLGELTYKTFASGGAFTKFSHEFQTLTDAGEDWLYLDRGKNIAVNEEVLDDAIKELGLRRENLERVRAAEVGNIFNFGAEKGKSMGIYYTDENNERQPLYLASYGIGVTRVMGVIAEVFSDERGLVWPESVAPYQVALISIGDDAAVLNEAAKLYQELTDQGVSVLWDDRDARAGEKFADADLIGLPHRVVVSGKLLKEQQFEYKARTGAQPENLTRAALLKKLVA